MKLAKIATVFGGLNSLLIGISGCLLLILALPLADCFFSVLGAGIMDQRKIGLTFASVFVPAPILFLELGFYWIRNGSRMGDTRGAYPTANVWSVLGRILLWIGLIVSVALILALLAFLALELVILVVVLIREPSSLTRPVTIMTAMLGFYAGVRILLWIFWRMTGKKSISQDYSLGLAKYRLIDGGVEIDLNYPIQIGKPGPGRFAVRFDELEEVRCLTYAETLAYLGYTVGPNVELGIREIREIYQWRTGKIPRPTVHLTTAENPFGKKILLRGPEVLYLISFHTDPAGLLETFRRSRPSAAVSAAESSQGGI